ncbi:MAG: nickel-dependent lactate racemase [Pyrinomonadaceae bacterium]
MPVIDLRWGTRNIPFAFNEDRFIVLGVADDRPPLSDVQIGERLDAPIGTPTIEEVVSDGETVLIVVPDATRDVGSGQIVNLVVRRLIASGINPFDIRIIFATGIHRRVTEEEKQKIVTPFVAQRIKTLDHEPRDLMQIVRLGETSFGLPIELNRALVEHDHVILVGGVSFHYFAGFTGGRKLICPGLASSKTVSATHKLAFDCEWLDRRHGVGSGILDGNPVHEAFVEVASKINVSFCITTDVNEAGDIVELHRGDLTTSHRAACDTFAQRHSIEISEKRDIVIVSAGGYPHDVNMIQAHKALDSAAVACNDGGMIVLLAECSEGLGRTDFLKWFNAENSDALARHLCESYQVNGQTAWTLLRKTEKFDVRIVTTLPADATEKMRMVSMQSLDRTMKKSVKEKAGYILPYGAKTLIREITS